MLAISTVMKNAMKMNWTLTDDFQIYINCPGQPIQGTNTSLSINDMYEVAVKSVDIPELGSPASQVMQGGEWRIYNEKFNPFTLSVTFRDFNGLDLRNYFSKVWMEAQRGYFDDVRVTVTISAKGSVIFHSTECLITSVSQVQFDNETTQIAEFTVSFTSPYYSNSEIRDFGSDSYRQSESAVHLNLGNYGEGLSESIGGIMGVAREASDIYTMGKNIINNVSDWFN